MGYEPRHNPALIKLNLNGGTKRRLIIMSLSILVSMQYSRTYESL